MAELSEVYGKFVEINGVLAQSEVRGGFDSSLLPLEQSEAYQEEVALFVPDFALSKLTAVDFLNFRLLNKAPIYSSSKINGVVILVPE